MASCRGMLEASEGGDSLTDERWEPMGLLPVGEGGSGIRLGGGGEWPPMCELCRLAGAVAYCRNDNAFLCSACNAEVHLSNPLSGRHQVLPLAAYLAERAVTGQQQALSPGSPRTGSDSQTSTLGLLNPASSFEFAKHGSVEDCIANIGRYMSGNSNSNDNNHQSSMKNELTPDLSAFNLFLEDHALDSGSPPLEGMKLDNYWIDELEKKETSKPDTGAEIDAGIPVAASKPMLPSDPVKGQISEEAICSYGAMGMLPYCSGAQPHPDWFPFVTNVPQVSWPCVVPGVPLFCHQSSFDGKLDRKARVARYLEKRKARSFENKIRYASRKAYAEVRPRIKGRFAKKEEVEAYLREQEEKAQAKELSSQHRLEYP